MAELERPTPEAMLARLRAQAPPGRGRLKVYFGYAAGVGKTYKMLAEARRLAADGLDVLVGYVEPHGRPETEALLEGLEVLPVLEIDYRGRALREFDLDAALARRPAIILVDELPHTNPPGLRQAKRWQDIDELLDAGIDVHTTCNVQHVESLNDIIAQISGVTVRETVPDAFFDRAQELALVDLPPDELLERLREGKVYLPERAEQALRHFFSRGNLVALRELALRRAADHIHADVETARRGQAGPHVWATRERLLVCVGPSPTSAAVIRAARRLAESIGAEWIALHVEVAHAPLAAEARQALLANLQLAGRLGAECVAITGGELVGEALRYAAQRNVTKIVVGRSPARPWHRATVTDRLLRDSGEIDVIVVHGAAEHEAAAWAPEPPASWRGWLGMAAALGICTAAAMTLFHLGLSEANLVMVYLAGVVLVAVRWGRRPAIVGSVASVLLFDVLYIEPRFSVAVSDTQYLITFAVMLTIGWLIAELTARLRLQAELARRGERRTEALYRLARRLTGAGDPDAVVGAAEAEVSEVFGGAAAIYRNSGGSVQPMVGHPAPYAASSAEAAVAQWVMDHGRPAGRGTDTLPAAAALHLPLAAGNGVLAVLAVAHDDPARLLLPAQRGLLDAFAAQIALALQRVCLADEAEQARLEASAESLRSGLLASVSHDLRTPLAVIAGATSTLLEQKADGAAAQRELLEAVHDEAQRLSRLVSNLLRLTQLQAGVALAVDWHAVGDVIGSALHATERSLGERPVSVHITPELLLGQFDAVLVEQLLINLLDNASRYTPPGSPVAIAAARRGSRLVIELADRGPGLAPGDSERIFETFQRGSGAKADSRGAGLGLAICRAVATAHGGTIRATNREEGGALFRLELPQLEPPPSLDFLAEEDADE